MTKRVPVEPAPGPLEDYAARFDDLFTSRAQREGFRRYLEGLLVADERLVTLIALANTEPVVGSITIRGTTTLAIGRSRKDHGSVVCRALTGRFYGHTQHTREHVSM